MQEVESNLCGPSPLTRARSGEEHSLANLVVCRIVRLSEYELMARTESAKMSTMRIQAALIQRLLWLTRALKKRSARAYFQAQAFTWSVPSSFTSTSNAPIVLLAGASFCELVQYWAAPRMLAFQPAPVGQPTPCPLKLTDSPPFVKK